MKSCKLLQKRIQTVVPILILIVGILGCYLFFLQESTDMLSQQNSQYIQSCTQDMQAVIDNNFKNALSAIEAMAYLYGNTATDAESRYTNLNNIQTKGPFDYIRYFDANGDAYSSEGKIVVNGHVLNSSDRDYFKRIMAGESGIASIKDSHINGCGDIVFYAPVTQDGTVIGGLVASYSKKTLSNIMERYYYTYKADTYLVDEKGNIIVSEHGDYMSSVNGSSKEADTMESLFKQTDYLDKETQQGVRCAYQTMTHYAFRFHGAYSDSYAYMTRLQSTDLMLIHTFPSQAQRLLAERTNQAGRHLGVGIGIVFLMYVAYSSTLHIINRSRIKNNLEIQKHLARTDAQTKLNNRRAYREKIDSLKSHERLDEVTLVVLDVNGLKSVNDGLGHQAGDELLVAAGKILSEEFRGLGDVYRVGGDEFIVVADHSIPDLSQRLKRFDERASLWHGELSSGLTASYGVACMKELKKPDVTALEKLADKRMYEAKKRYYESAT